jgi:hypothetical protein
MPTMIRTWVKPSAGTIGCVIPNSLLQRRLQTNRPADGADDEG